METLKKLGLLLGAVLAAPGVFGAAVAPPPPVGRDLLPSLSVAKTTTPWSIKVLSLNVAGIPVVHKQWEERRAEIARRLRDSTYDIVALQEMWPDKDAMSLFRESGYPFYARYPSLGGTGLMILSRYPISEVKERPFSCFPPSAWTVYQGETISTKGALMARVRLPAGPLPVDGGGGTAAPRSNGPRTSGRSNGPRTSGRTPGAARELDVYSTHLVADYPMHNYSSVRTAQVFELAETVAGWSAGRPFVVLGDLNTGPGDEEYAFARDLLNASDACLSEKGEACPETARRARIDHVLLSPGIKVLGAGRLPFDRPPGVGATPLSDHPGIWAQLAPTGAAAPAPDRSRALRAMRSVLDRAIKKLYSSRKWWSWVPLYGTIHSLSYGREIAAMEAVRFRVQSAAIVAGSVKISQNRLQ